MDRLISIDGQTKMVQQSNINYYTALGWQIFISPLQGYVIPNVASFYNQFIPSGFNTSIEDSDHKEFVKIYPNPTSGLLTIKIASVNSEIFEFNLFDGMGRNICSYQIVVNKTNELKLQNQENGIYYYEIRNLHGEISSRGKIALIK